MKTWPLLLLLFIGLGVAIFFSTLLKSSHYVHFEEARALFEKKGENAVYVIGTLARDTQNKVIGIEHAPHQMAFSFRLVDKAGYTERVYYNDVMPMDFKRSEQVVVIGSYDADKRFRAKKILMKCPSKYTENGSSLVQARS